MERFLYEKESYAIRGCLMSVFNELGSGFLEKVYQEALEREFIEKKIPYKREAPLTIMYKGLPLQQFYIADFICYDKIIVELKAVSELTDVHSAQVFNYLKATGFDLAILVNYGEKNLKVERLFNYKKNQKNQKNS
ncbi:MAG: GxxExxY protein [Muribaculaceae bacterium]|nr:GxxExxY protein [Muribaculaceae bacterium]